MPDKDLDSNNKYRKMRYKEVVEVFKNAVSKDLVDKYKKTVRTLARPAKEGEEIFTEINGKKRTKNKANEGDFIVKNPDGEEYILSEDRFKKRYKLVSEAKEQSNYRAYQAFGKVWAFQYNGPDLKIEAPWGEEQIIKDGDMIASLNKYSYDDIYGIQIDIFKETYKKVG